MLIEEVLIVKHQGNLYGINTKNVEHILRVIPITPVPLAPTAVRGLCAIEGSIVSVLDLSRLLFENISIDETMPNARLITIHSEHMKYSILTEEVVNNITIDQDNIEYVSERNLRDDGVIAVYKYNSNILQVIDISILIKKVVLAEFTLKNITERVQGVINKSDHNDKKRRYLLFGMGKEKYGLEVSKIREVISLPESFTDIADASEHMIGMMTLRDELLVVADLRMIYNFSPMNSERNRIIVINSNEKIMGVVVDEIVDIIDFPIDEIEYMPNNFKDDKIIGIAYINKELISLIDIAVIDKLIDSESRVENSALIELKNSDIEDMIEIVSFTLGNNNYAFKTEEVVEIIDSFEITHVPDMSSMVEGVTNIRGKVIPIVKLYEKLEVEERRSENKKLIVCNLHLSSIGIVVDSVTNVKKMAKELFIPEDESPYFTHIVKEKKGVLLMIDLLEVFSEFYEGKE